MSKYLQNTDKNDINISKSGKLDLLNINTSALTASLNDLAIPRLFYQLVIFIIDGSNSMNEDSKNGISKANEIDKGIRSIIQRLKKSKNNNSFDVCFLAFSDDFEDVFSLKNVKDISIEQSFNPLKYVTPKGTKLNRALLHSKEIVNDYHLKNKLKNCQVLIQILSDGAISDYDESIKTVNDLKNIKNTTVSCQFLESHIEQGQEWYSSNEATGEIDYSSRWTIEEVRQDEERIANRFKNFASSIDLFVTSIDPEEIRKHMIKSISTVSKID
ncbi:vWA domain-containing protein [Thalassobellus suaedae]|uniref:VWA domain-containing protein n=1 Tax=Thalassobellus suaedae TaxID=3074124 RepID=A0ABY9Y0J6_9FLAO|nr:VWA domain-containing protein [Flavobacteriaceae bacterium HL-DH10]